MGHTGPHWGYYTGATLGQKKMCQPSACAAPAITSISWPIPNPQRPHPFPSYPRHFQFFPYSCSLLAASHTPQPPPHPPSLAFRPVRDEFFDAFHDAFPEVFVSTAIDIEPRPLSLLYQAALLPKPSAFPQTIVYHCPAALVIVGFHLDSCRYHRPGSPQFLSSQL